MVQQLPFVSVIMAVRNESTFIVQSVSSILTQDYPRECMEVIIADGNSSDDTAGKIEALGESDHRIRLIHNPAGTIPQGLNSAISVARGNYIVRVDGHTILSPNYIQTCVETWWATGAECVGGNINPVGLTPMGRAIATAYRSRFCVPSRYKVNHYTGPTDMVYMGAWPREVFDKVRFDERLHANQDYMLAYEIRKMGGTVYLAPQIHSLYYGRQTLKALWKQYFRYGRYKLIALSRAPESVKPRQLAAPSFVFALVVGGILSLFSKRIGWLWQMMLGVYGTMMGLATLKVLRQEVHDPAEQEAQLWRVPLVFLTVHLAWGLGFLEELGHKILSTSQQDK
jgi:succinoglycan biosynthesis protein ExoA